MPAGIASYRAPCNSPRRGARVAFMLRSHGPSSPNNAPRGYRPARAANKCAGLFVVGTDTAVGKTFVASRIAAALKREGLRVGVYKPAASGCRREGKSLVSDDA